MTPSNQEKAPSPSLRRRRLLAALAALGLGGTILWLARPRVDPAAHAALSRLVYTKLQEPDGTPRRIAEDWRERVRVINFWATWCPPCRAELPLLAAASRAWKEEEVQFLGLALDDKEAVRRYLAHTPLPYPILLAPPTLLDLTAELGNPHRALPFTLVIGPRNERIASHVGPVTKEKLDGWIKAALAAGTTPH
ncbi:MAG: TlpA disulfide reductase family protein [Tepidiphilus sp.]|nr:TlpA disulfide reductase family protein [Tepidiphilus sp.]